jgi:hypothetical protein
MDCTTFQVQSPFSLHLQPHEFSLVIQALLQLENNEDAYNLASHLQQAAQARDQGEIGGCLAYLQTHINPSDEGSYAQLTETGKNMRYHPYREDREGEGQNEPQGKRNCKRNGRVKGRAAFANWGIGEEMAKTSNLSCEAVISALAVVHPQALRRDLDAWIEALQDLRPDLRDPQPERGSFLLDGSLSTLLQQCQDSTDSFLKSEFVSMLSRMQLAIKCQRQVLSLPVLVFLIFLLL